MDAMNYHKSRKGLKGNFHASNGVMPTHGLVWNVDDLDFGIVGPTCQIGWLAHPSVVRKRDYDSKIAVRLDICLITVDMFIQ